MYRHLMLQKCWENKAKREEGCQRKDDEYLAGVPSKQKREITTKKNPEDEQELNNTIDHYIMLG